MANKTAIVTGGSRGIGAAIVKRLAAEGMNVVFNYHSAKAAGEAVLAECRKLGVNGLMVQADVSSKEDCKKMVEAAVEKFGGVDVLVNNAGIDGPVHPVNEYVEDDFEKVMRTNVMSVFYLTKYVSQKMIEAGKGGSIVNLSSITAKYGSSGNGAYCASKAAVDGFTRSAAKDLAQYNINVNTVAPGVTETDMVRNLPQVYKDQMSKSIRFGRFCQPEEIANAVAFFAKEESRYVTAQMLVVDGITNL